MSSYLHICLHKSVDNPMILFGYSRNTLIYQYVAEYIGTYDDYTPFTNDQIQTVREIIAKEIKEHLSTVNFLQKIPVYSEELLLKRDSELEEIKDLQDALRQINVIKYLYDTCKNGTLCEFDEIGFFIV